MFDQNADMATHRDVEVESGVVINPSSTRILLTPQNLLVIGSIIVSAAVAWQKIPNAEEVQRIATQSIEQTNQAMDKRSGELERRLQLLETQSSNMNMELMKMNKRMDYLIIIMAGSAAEGMQRSSKARSTAEKVKRNLELGDEPLEGVSWGPK